MKIWVTCQRPRRLEIVLIITTNSLQTSENVKLVCETKNHTIKLNIPDNIHMIFIKNGHKLGKIILAYYFWIRKYELKCVFDHFWSNYHN